MTNIGSVKRCKLSISQITPASPGQHLFANSCEINDIEVEDPNFVIKFQKNLTSLSFTCLIDPYLSIATLKSPCDR